MKKSFLALCLGVSLPCVALAQLTPVIDPQWRPIDLKMRQDQKNCDRLNIVRAQNCTVEVRQKYISKGVVPGTEEYIRKKYGSMSVSQLEDVEKQMNHKYTGHVRYVDNISSTKPEPGEITNHMVEENARYLNQLIDEKGGRQDPLDTMFGKKTKHYRFE